MLLLLKPPGHKLHEKAVVEDGVFQRAAGGMELGQVLCGKRCLPVLWCAVPFNCWCPCLRLSTAVLVVVVLVLVVAAAAVVVVVLVVVLVVAAVVVFVVHPERCDPPTHATLPPDK